MRGLRLKIHFQSQSLHYNPWMSHLLPRASTPQTSKQKVIQFFDVLPLLVLLVSDLLLLTFADTPMSPPVVATSSRSDKGKSSRMEESLVADLVEGMPSSTIVDEDADRIAPQLLLLLGMEIWNWKEGFALPLCLLSVSNVGE
ncbi:uncharacterized protein LOC111403531 [Olea europaea var. sylvestris]|uniref:uncharacterized protein LOC111403531 n=1 Tax=Olea europaea var. sylvestris TaxID=158386 RepID=UPI000C1D6938|nr:uncharacterized protein LOC111403531 [Olea europaea var. sylvestris]